MRQLTLVGALLPLALACDCPDEPPIEAEETIVLTSTAFEPGEKIPKRHTCSGEDISPPLDWSNVPASTQSLVLTVDDPDARRCTWTHWVLYNIPAGTTSLEEDVPGDEHVLGSAAQGKNGWGRIGYDGPCPPSRDGSHRYFFEINALDTALDLEPGMSKIDVLEAIAPHVLSQGRLMGKYGR